MPRLEAWKMPRVVRWVLTYTFIGKEKVMEKNTKRKVSVEELNELSIVGGNDGNPEPVCSLSNIIITTVLVSLVSISYFTTSPEQC